MLIKKAAVVGAGLLLVAGCTTLSDDAPVELHSAKASLDKAYEEDVDDKLPNTIEKADSSFKEGVKLYEDSVSLQGDDQPALAMDAKKEAIDKANESNKLSTSAMSLHDDLMAWDNDIALYTQVKSDADLTEDLQNQLAELEGGTQGVISDDFQIVKPVAFFMTDNADLDKSLESDVENLTALLQKQKQLYVELTGFADFRGPETYNKELGMRRAQAVAEILKSKGIESSRIKLTTLGSDLAINDTSDLARLQLDRRVEAKLTVLSH